MVKLAYPNLIAQKLKESKKSNFKGTTGIFSGLQLQNKDSFTEENLAIVQGCFDKVYKNGEHGQNLELLLEYLGFLARFDRKQALKILSRVKVEKLTPEQLIYFNGKVIPFVCDFVVQKDVPLGSVELLIPLVSSSEERLLPEISKLSSEALETLDKLTNEEQEKTQEFEKTLLQDIENADEIRDALAARAAYHTAHSAVCRGLAKVDTNAAYDYFTKHFKLYGYKLLEQPEMKSQLEQGLEQEKTPLFVASFLQTYQPILVNMMKRPHLCYKNLLKLAYSLKSQRDAECPTRKITVLDEVHRVVKVNNRRANKRLPTFERDRVKVRVFDRNCDILRRADTMKFIPQKTIPSNVDGLPR